MTYRVELTARAGRNLRRIYQDIIPTVILYDRRYYTVDEGSRIVTVLHIHHGAQDAFLPDD